MNNYYAYSNGFFNIELEELKKLKEIQLTRKNEDEVTQYFLKTCGKQVGSYSMYYIPLHLKRNDKDNAKILVLALKDRLLAKRFNNSQHLKIL